MEEHNADEPAVPAGTESRRLGITLFHGKGAPGLSESGTMSFPVFDAADQLAIAARRAT